MPLSSHAKKAYNRLKQKEFRERRKAAGLCRNCGADLDSDKSDTRCLRCHTRHLHRNAQYARVRAILEKTE